MWTLIFVAFFVVIFLQLVAEQAVYVLILSFFQVTSF